MNEQNFCNGGILPVPEGTQRPLWSVMIPTYNCAHYLREALLSVLTQDPGAELMQIEVVDDCSTKDDPKSVAEEMGQGRVQFYCQPRNVGHKENFNTCLQRSRGKLVHLLHGDDGVRDGFYQTMQMVFEREPSIGAAFCRHIIIDERDQWQSFSTLQATDAGILGNWLSRIAVINRLQPPAIVVRRGVYEAIGGFDSRIMCCGEDWEMWVRIAAHCSVWYEPEPLALYRAHSSTLTGRCARTGQNVRDMGKIIEIIQSYLPEDAATALVEQAKENCALYAVNYILPQMLHNQEWNAAKRQIQEILKLKSSPAVLLEMAKTNFRSWKGWVKRTLPSVVKSPFSSANYAP